MTARCTCTRHPLALALAGFAGGFLAAALVSSGPPPRAPCGAPAPLPRRRAAPAPFAPGAYVLHWGGTRWPMRLSPGGAYECGESYRGRWCVVEGTLYVSETCNGGIDWHWWSWRPGDERAAGDYGEVEARVERAE